MCLIRAETTFVALQEWNFRLGARLPDTVDLDQYVVTSITPAISCAETGGGGGGLFIRGLPLQNTLSHRELTGTVPLFCRFVLPCQILLPPIKTVVSTI